MAQILLPRDPKVPVTERPADLSHWIDLIELKPELDRVLERTPIVAREDAMAFISANPPIQGAA
jgi:hypothetical protein